MQADASVFVAGGETLLGGAIVRRLEADGQWRLVGVAEEEPDLRSAGQVDAFFERNRPDYVFLAAGKSGGIHANQHAPAELMLDNLLVTTHVVRAAYEHGVKKLLYLASSCSYPRLAPQPLEIESLFSGPLEPTNQAYAVAKLAGLTLCQAYRAQHGCDFVTVIPANAFGPGDDFDPLEAHVVPSLLARMHQARQVGAPTLSIWGSGRARREFVYSEDLAVGCLFLMKNYSGPQPINLGGGVDLSIRELAIAIKQVVGYSGELLFDISKPDGMPLKALGSAAVAGMGWRPHTPFADALACTYQWYLRRQPQEVPTHA